MIIKNLKLSGFRNLADTDFTPDKEMNILCGENAQGKTNVIEAVWLFTGAKSFRTNKDPEMIQFGRQKATLCITFETQGIEKTAKIEIGLKRKAKINEKALSSASCLAGNFYAVVFSPNDLSLVKDGPSVRRRFLDLAIGQLYPNYINILRSYLRGVSQRNSILKDSLKDSTLNILLDGFEEKIAEDGIKIYKYRKKYIEMLTQYAPQIYLDLSDKKEKLKIEYLCSANEDNFSELLKNSRRDDAFRGATSVGPHRDDIAFFINGNNARNYASQGQQRSVALSLKLSEAEIVKNITGEQPVALLDDVMSELDKSRQNYILNHIKGWQVFITCCDNDQIDNLKSGKIFTVDRGEIF